MIRSWQTMSEVKNGLVRIAIAYTGDFVMGERKFSITLADLEEMARNLSRREVPLDYQHYSGEAAARRQMPPAWIQAAGWIKRPDKIKGFKGGEKILWAWAQLTADCLTAIRDKKLRYLSLELS